MKASELITKLQALIDEHGDLPVALMDYSSGAMVWLEGEPKRVKPARIDGQALFEEAILIPAV